MNADVHWLDEYCNAKLASQSYGKLLGPLIKEYKINLDRYITSILALVDRDDGYGNHPIDLPNTYAAQLLEAGMPFYYITVISALSKIAADRLQIKTNINSTDNPTVLMRSNINGKYLCAFVQELDDDLVDAIGVEVAFNEEGRLALGGLGESDHLFAVQIHRNLISFR